MLTYAASSLHEHAKTVRKRLECMMNLADLGKASVNADHVWFSRGFATLCVLSSGEINFRDPTCDEPVCTMISKVPHDQKEFSQLAALRMVQTAYKLVTNALDTAASTPQAAGGDGLWERPYAAICAAAALRNLTNPQVVLQAASFNSPAHAYVLSDNAHNLELSPDTVEELFAAIGQACKIDVLVQPTKLTIGVKHAFLSGAYAPDPVSTIRHLHVCKLTQEQLRLV